MDAGMKELVEKLKRHALDHYEDGGWDVIIECFTDEEIAEQLTEDKVVTFEDALASFKDQIDVWSDRQADARNSQF